MSPLNHLSIKSKLMLMLLAVSLSAIAVIGYLGHRSGSSALKDSIFNHLTSVRTSKAYQIESYFKNVRSHAATLGEDRMIAGAMTELKQAYGELADRPIARAWDAKVDAYYTQEFLPRLARNVEGAPSLEAFKPTTTAARFLQYHYIAQNPHPVGEKEALLQADDDSAYSAVHGRYHPLLRSLITRFGYYDLFLIDIDTEEIIYTVSKETDFATNLATGPYRETNLAKVVQAVREEPDRGAVKLTDFKTYRASYGEPAAFIAAPIHDGTRAVGVLALQLSVDEINKVMTGDRSWKRDGLGSTGEVYLVGQDALMRSVSRFLLEDPEEYRRALLTRGTPEKTVKLIEQIGTSILLQEVDTEGVREALAGQEGTRVIRDYRGVPVLSSYAPVRIDGVKWVILAEMDLSEADQPTQTFERQLLISAVVLILLTTLISAWLAHAFVRPISTLIDGARQVGAGRHDVLVKLTSHDELGELADTFNEMVRGIREQTALIEQKNRENEALLLNILPGPVAKRLKEGEERIADTVQQVTVLFASVVGFSELSEKKSADEAVALLNELVNSFDEAAERHGVEKVKTIGESYMAVSGLSVPRLDHAARTIEFALEMQRILQRWNRSHEAELSLQIGINSGAVMAGIVGAKKFIYDLWGETVNIAGRMYTQAAPNTILVTQNVYARLHDQYDFAEAPGIELHGKELIATWALEAVRRPADEDGGA